ncbi:unnamed protein product [Oikopleura dioica]|uniref:Major facilitator superfamily (MFS) profile domain-containing protein n=1 Tax=Oikopleura dioica TaxID=34765 RepID=E4Y5J6_OIKDI|nr:unnamed protein product [Oikopleura dioica]
MFIFGNFRDWYVAPGLAFGGFFVIFSIAPVIISSVTIISDFSTPDMKSTYQGLRCFTESLSCILGPLWGANMLHTRQWIFWPIIIFLVISISMICSSWSRLDVRKFKNNSRLNVEPEKLQKL